MIDISQPDFSNTPISSKRPAFSYMPARTDAPPLVTIITPFYNTGHEFEETANSVLRQSLQQWEWLIINDGTDASESLEILARFRSCDQRIRVIDQANCGLSAARNIGFAQARADYVFQLDSDDLIEPTALEKCYWFLLSHLEFSWVKGYTVGFGGQEYLWQRGFHQSSEFLKENSANATVMIRRATHQVVGGYDESRREGLEDWDFWLKCAAQGYWGSTIPEYLDWYRRRPAVGDRWANLRDDWQSRFISVAKARYPKLWAEGIPQISHRWHAPNEHVPMDIPAENLLSKSKQRILMVMPYLTVGGAEKYALDVLAELTMRHGFEISIATTLAGDHSRMHEYARYTPDIFALHHFLRLPDFPRFLIYLINSRQVDTVFISNSYLGYLLLPTLRANCPGVVFVDYLHMEEEYWKSGGYPRAALNYASQLDLTLVSSRHLFTWLTDRGLPDDQLAICSTNIDTEKWDPTRFDRARTRAELNIPHDMPTIIFAARLVDQKRPLLLGRCIQELESQGLDFVCLVAGDGPYRSALEELVRSGKCKRLKLLGAVDSERIQELMAASDVFFLPSLMEGISLALYESMAMGLAVVAADVGGQAELVTAECGYLVPSGNDEEDLYVEALKALISDPVRLRATGQAARARVVDHFKLSAMSNRLISLLDVAYRRAHMIQNEARTRGLANTIATEAIELTRLEALAEHLWSIRNSQVEIGSKQAVKVLVRRMIHSVPRSLQPHLLNLARGILSTFRRL